MADSIQFTLALIDKISGPARTATAALEKLQDQLKGIRELLKDMPKLSVSVPKTVGAAKEALGPMYGPTRKQADQAARYREREEQRQARASEKIAQQQAKAVEKVQRDQLRAADALDKQRSRELYKRYQEQQAAAEKAAAAHAGAGRGLLEAAGGGHALGIVDEVKRLGGQFEAVTGLSAKAAVGVAAFGAAAIAAGIGAVKLVHAIGELVFEGARLAIDATEAKGDTLDMLEAMLGSADAAERTLTAIRGVTKLTSASQEAVQASAQDLAAAGVTNEKLLSGAVQAVAQVDSVLKGKGEKIQSIFARAAQTGNFEVNAKRIAGTGIQLTALYEELSKSTGKGVKQIESLLKSGKIKAEQGIAALTATINKKFGAVAAKQALDIGPQIQRLRDNFSKLFEDVNTGPFLEALNRIVTLFDQATPTGKALHDVLTSTFDGVFKLITKVEPYVEVFFLGMELAALKVANAARRVAYSLGLSFGDQNQDSVRSFEDAMLGFADAVGKAAHGAEVLAGYQFVWDGVAKAASLVSTAVGPITNLLFPVFTLVKAFSDLGLAVLYALDWITKFGDEAEAAGANIIDGLIAGIRSGAGRLAESVTSMAHDALIKFKEVFGIHSPSRVMARMGGYMTAGLAQGMRSTAHVQSGAMVGAGAQLSSRTAVGAQLGLLNQVSPMAMNDNAIPARAEPERIQPRRAASGRQSGGPAILNMEAGAVVIQLGSGGVAELEQKFPDMMADWWERAALSLGAGPASETG